MPRKTPLTLRKRRRVHPERYSERPINNEGTEVGLNYVDVQIMESSEIEEHFLGPMSETCTHCHAKHFFGERTNGGFNSCCHRGKITSQIVPPVIAPLFLENLIKQGDKLSKHFLLNIRNYNSALAFASVQANMFQFKNRGPFCFKIHGQMYHSVASLYPQHGKDSKYAGLFIIDSEEALEKRMRRDANKQCSRSLMSSLTKLLNEINPYAKLFKHVHEIENNANFGKVPDYTLTFTENNAFDRRRYNHSQSEEIAAVFLSDDGAPFSSISFAIHSKFHNQRLTYISSLNPHSDPMAYPLLFPKGESSWKPGMSHNAVQSTAIRNAVTQLQYYCYLLAVRDGFSLLHSSGKLFQQFIVDAYVKVEGARVAYIKSHQKELRAENYKGLMDFVGSEAEARGVYAGIPIVLPSTFIGSPRNMLQNYQDAMAIVAHYGKPDLFITFTANAKWREIAENVPVYQSIEHRPDLVARVFYLKLQELMTDIKERHIFGRVIAHFHVIEFQKRGLPHAHILLILNNRNKFREPNDVDLVAVAELPERELNATLFEKVSKFMIHGPCGTFNPSSPCMEEGKCKKGYPKEFVQQTKTNVNGYPLYRRRDNKNEVLINGFKMDNRWVVPYNPFLIMKYNAHINVEVCSSIKCIKYLFKYIYKGHDCAALKVQESPDNEGSLVVDEISAHINARYVSPPEAAWRLNEHYLQKRSHSIERLPIHLPNEQMIYFKQGGERQAIDAAVSRHTKLTAWFELNNTGDTFARNLFYKDIPEHYTWKNNQWQRRRRSCYCIGRMYTVNPLDCERFFLRTILLHRKGATSFEDLRTVNSKVYDSFSSAAKALNLADDDDEWRECLQEAIIFAMPRQLRELFAYLSVFCCISNVKDLWEQFKNELSEDFRLSNDEDTSFRLALGEIDKILSSHGMDCSKFHLPAPIRDSTNLCVVDLEQEMMHARDFYARLNNEQKGIVDEVLNCVKSGHSSSWFIDGPGGTGKTFLYKCITHILRAEGNIVIVVAWTGIAATLIEGGRTAHSTFKFPVPLTESSTSSMRPNSPEAENLRKAALIIWDEMSMVPKHALTVLDKLLKDIMQCGETFGGKCILFGGDFRQILPVVRNCNRVAICEECIKFSPLWPAIKQFKLTKNMRALQDYTFSEWLMQLGNGTLPVNKDISQSAVEIPFKCIQNDDIVGEIFNQPIQIGSTDYYYNRTILCPKNEDSFNINDRIVSELIDGESKDYYSVDSLELETNEPDYQLYPTEFLNSLNPSGLPPHKLTLKKGAVIMLIRNLDTMRGLVNGTRMIVTQMHTNSLEAQVITGEARLKSVIIPRIILTPSDHTMPFKLKRRQFPIRLAFAMTINKSQGQTFDKIGIFLPSPVFTHGQLYVAFSRVQNFESVKIKISDNSEQGKQTNCEKVYTSNIVYKEIL